MSNVSIVTVDEMEEVVSKSRWLEWDGWDVLHYGRPSSELSATAVFKGGRWVTVRRYQPDANGWTIPGKLL